MKFKEITLRRGQKLQKANINLELQWFSNSLGLFSQRDKDRSCFRIFIELLKSTKMQKPVSSDELAFKLKLSRGTVVYHLNRLMDAGIAVVHKNKYLLRAASLKFLISELKKDTDSFFESMLDVAEDIDKSMS